METELYSNSYSLGKALASEWKKKNISLENISETTNISLKSLEALENEEFHRIPGEFYLKNYIITYLKAIGCDEKEFFKTHSEALQDVCPGCKEKKTTYYSKLRYSRFKKKRVFFSGFIFFVLFVGVFIVLYLGKKDVPTRPVDLPVTGFSLEPFTKVNAFNIDYWPVRVDIEFLDRCWIRVQRGSRQSQKQTSEKVFEKGERLEIKGYALDFLIGNPAAVRFYVNNKEVKVFKDKPGAERITITPWEVNTILNR